MTSTRCTGRWPCVGYIQDWLDSFDDFSFAMEELRDVGDDRCSRFGA